MPCATVSQKFFRISAWFSWLKNGANFFERILLMQTGAIILATVFIVAFGSLFAQGNSREVTIHTGPGA